MYEIDIQADWAESQRARKELLEEQREELAAVSEAMVRVLIQERRLFIYGSGTLSGIAAYIGRYFLSGGVSGRGRRFALGVLEQPVDLAALNQTGDTLLWLALQPDRDTEFKPIFEARQRGVRIIAFAPRASQVVATMSDRCFTIPSAHHAVVAELLISIFHSLYKLVSENEAVRGEAAPEASPPVIPPVAPPVGGGAITFWGPGDAPTADNLDPIGDGLPTRPPEAIADAVTERTIRVRCKACAEVITVSERHRGKRGKCPRCQEDMKIPSQRSAESRKRPRPSAEPVEEVEAEVKPRPSAPSRRVTALDNSKRAPRRRVTNNIQRSSTRASKAVLLRKSARARKLASKRSARSNTRAAPKVERRGCVRFEVLGARAIFKVEGVWGSEDRSEKVSDLSLSGAGVNLRYHQLDLFEVGDEIGIAVDVPAFADSLKARATITRIDKRGKDVHMGLVFTAFKKDAEKKLRRLQDNAALRAVPRR